jgi:uncharacterized membrane protein HdeD (DUF308 family)
MQYIYLYWYRQHSVLLFFLGIVLLILGLAGLVTSCARSFALSYSLAFILFFAIIIQGVLAILIVFFRYSTLFQKPSAITHLTG